MNVQIHSSAIVDEGAQIDEGSRVQLFGYVCVDAKIGKDALIEQNVFTGDKANSDDECEVKKVSIYDSVISKKSVLSASLWRLLISATRTH